MRHRIAINKMSLEGKLAQGDPRWGTFNGSFENHEWDEYDIGDAIIEGHSYTSWHSPEYRKSDNWMCSQFIAVDLDTGDERSSLKYLENHELVRMYGTLLHTTPSHTEEHPRARALFLVDRPIDNPRTYNHAATALATTLGGDTVSTDPSRFFYGNAGGNLKRIGRVMPLTILRFIYNKMPKPAIKRANRAPIKPFSGTPKDKFSDIASLLPRINANSIHYDKWINVFVITKYELGDAGLPLIMDWAMDEPSTIEAKWNSIKEFHNPPLTVKTLQMYANQA